MTFVSAAHADAVAALDAAGALAVCTWMVREGEAHLVAANPAFEALLGYQPGTLLETAPEASLTWRSLTSSGNGSPIDDRDIALGHGAPAAAECTLIGRDGQATAVLITTVPGRKPHMLASLCVDVSQQAAARRDAEQASQAKSRFLSVMSHELRTPLNIIHGSIDLLREGVFGAPDHPQQKALDRVHRAGRRLKEVIDSVLTFSRLETGQVAYDLTSVSLAAVLPPVIDAVASQCSAKQQTIDLMLPDDDVRLTADREKLHTALLALLSNASKFTPVGGHITIDTAARPEVRDFFFIRVTDTGAGVPRDHFESIFSPFAQADERRVRTAEGLGLGLTIARDLVRGMGGDIRVRSQPGSGATFTLAVRRA